MGFVNLKAEYKNRKEEINEAIQKVLNHSVFIEGPEVKELENKLAAYVGVKHCITVANGTEALLISLMSKGISCGDEIITTPFTWISTSEVIAWLGAKPIFVDINPDTFNLDPEKLERAITNKTKAILPVSLFGQMTKLEEINAIAKKHQLFVIEDAAQSFGAIRNGNRSCSMSTLSTTSFYPSKPFGCYGDGGAIFTNDESLNEKIRIIKNHGCIGKNLYGFVGVNSRLDTIQAAILLVKLKYFEKDLQLRKLVANRYNEELKNIVEIPVVDEFNTHTYAEYTIKTDKRDQLCTIMKEKKLPYAIYYSKCVFEQPAYKECSVNDIIHALQVSKKVVSLPIYPFMLEEEQNHIIEVVKERLLQECLV